MATATSPLVEQRVVDFALGHPGFGPARMAPSTIRKMPTPMLISHVLHGADGDSRLPACRAGTRLYYGGIKWGDAISRLCRSDA
jgi:hypothetical protein